MSRLVLHVGMHKTGTTAVQQALSDGRRALRRHGVVYPRIGTSHGHHALVAPWNPNLEGFAGDMEDPREAWRDLAREHAGSDRTVVISSEELSRQGTRNRPDLAWIAEAVSGFDEVAVVLVLRDQISMLQSIWLEVAKKKKVLDWAAFVKRAAKSGIATGLPLDYGVIYDAFAAAFGAASVKVLDYAEARQGGTILNAVMAAGGLGEVPVGAAATRLANVSPAPLALWVAQRISQPAPPDAALIAQVGGVIEAMHPGAATTLYAAEEMRLVRKAFGPANAVLRKRIARDGGAPPELAWMPAKGLVRRDKLDEAFWVEIARSLRPGAARDGTAA